MTRSYDIYFMVKKIAELTGYDNIFYRNYNAYSNMKLFFSHMKENNNYSNIMRIDFICSLVTVRFP